MTSNFDDDDMPLDPDEQLVPQQSDEALAIEFAQTYRPELRYVAAWNRWYIWDGHLWKHDETLAAFDLARKLVRRVVNQMPNGKEAKLLASSRTVNAVQSLAKADRRLAATIDQWDRNSMLLNTPAGVVDLATGKLSEHRREEYITKSTAVAPKGACPMWLTFLARVTGDDPELMQYLRRMAGYLLTGSTSEHALFFLYGLGANGKSVMLSTIAGIMSDYHRTAPITTFTEAKSEQHPTDLAMLVGARAVTAIETEEGRRWAESKIKSLTGGDRVAARFMRQDFFEFTPTFKLVIAGNHKPGLRSVDEAIRRRFNLIPFTVIIPPNERDPMLVEKLKVEWPGILNWMLEGCLEWQRVGLRPPQAVIEATDDYLEAEDAIGLWIDEDCTVEKNAAAPAGALFMAWQEWAKENGEFAGSQKRFSQKLIDRGFEPAKINSQRSFIGLKLKSQERLARM